MRFTNQVQKTNKNNNHALLIIGFWMVILVLAVYSRLFQLNRIPFDTLEAQYALEILNLQDVNVFAFANPLGFSFIKALLVVFENQPWVFRFIPSLSGIAIVLLPFFLRHHLGEFIPLGLSVLFLLDPFLAGNSRLVYGYAFPFLCLFILLLSILDKRPTWIGIWIGFGLSSGWRFLYIGIFFVFAIALFINLFKGDQILRKTLNKYRSAFDLKLILLGFIYSVGSYFLISAMTGSSPLAILNQLPVPTNTIKIEAGYIDQFSVKLLTLLSYAFPLWMAGMVFGFIGIGNRNKTLAFFLLLQVIATFMILLIPFYTALDLSFAILPAIVNIVLGMEILFKEYKFVDIKSLSILIIILIVLTAFIWLNLLRILSISWNSQVVWGALFSILITLALAVVIILFIMQFGKVVTIKYSIWGTVVIFLILFQIASVSRITGISSIPTQEIMLSGNACSGMNDLNKVLVEVRNLNLSKGNIDQVDISSELPCELYTLSTLGITPGDTNSKNDPKPIVISANSRFDPQDTTYAGMTLSSTAYPSWKEQGFHALTDVTYWRWLFLRQGKLTQSFSYLWIKNEFL